MNCIKCGTDLGFNNTSTGLCWGCASCTPFVPPLTTCPDCRRSTSGRCGMHASYIVTFSSAGMPESVPAVATPVGEGKADPSRKDLQVSELADSTETP